MHDDISWKDVKRTVATSRFCALATVTEDGTPKVTPIGSVIFTSEKSGFYFEDDPSIMPGDLERAPELAIVAVGGAKDSWLGSVFRSKLPTARALRLSVHAGRRRAATAAEKACRFVGIGLLGKGVRFVREFTVEAVAPIHLGALYK